jgi:hypothetical protein
MSDETSPGDTPTRQSDPVRTQPRDERPWFRRIAFAPLWLASVLVLSLGIAAIAAYLMTRQPDVVERIAAPPPPAELSPEVVRRAEALRALNSALANQIDALRQQIEQPKCPPGTAIDTTDNVGITRTLPDRQAAQQPGHRLLFAQVDFGRPPPLTHGSR